MAEKSEWIPFGNPKVFPWQALLAGFSSATFELHFFVFFSKSDKEHGPQ